MLTKSMSTEVDKLGTPKIFPRLYVLYRVARVFEMLMSTSVDKMVVDIGRHFYQFCESRRGVVR